MLHFNYMIEREIVCTVSRVMHSQLHFGNGYANIG